ncbi:MAG: ferrochelatase [Terracidiphilus sp.]|jgi:ferrochelatase
MAKQAVLLLAHGTPETVEQIPEYLSNVTSGRPLPSEVVEEIQRRYALIGHSPLTEITIEQGRRVAAELAAIGQSVPVYVAMRNWHPYIADVVRKMHNDQVEEAAVLCLAPQNSRTSVGLYRRALETAMAAEAAGLRIDLTEGWAQHPLLINAFVERLRPAWSKLSAEVGADVPVLFTAHSVPARTIQASEGQPADPYAVEARRTAELVAERIPEIPQWFFAFQSQGVSGGPWLGPTVEETLQSVAASGAKTVLLQPIGFLCDHVEILYDVDIFFRTFAKKLNLRLERTESLNASGTLAKAIADLARQGLERLNSR